MMTERQKEYYESIKSFIEKYKFSPSFREIGEIVGASSTASVNDMLKKLRNIGCIDYKDNCSRTIVIKEISNI